MKKTFLVFYLLLCSVFICACSVFALEVEGVDLIEPAVDLDLVMLHNNQSTSVTADLSFQFDFELVPVVLIGNGNFSMSLSKTDSKGEIAYIAFYGFGVPTVGINAGLTPVTLRLNSKISDVDSWAVGLIMHGILFSPEDPPYEYKISLSF